MRQNGLGTLYRKQNGFQPPTPTGAEWSAFKAHLSALPLPDQDPEVPASLLQIFRREEWPRLIAADSPADWEKSRAASRNGSPSGGSTLSQALQNHLVLKRLLDRAMESDPARSGTTGLEWIPDWMLASTLEGLEREPRRPLSEAGSAVESLLKSAAAQLAHTFQELCRAATIRNGTRLAWVGLLSESTRSLEIAGWAGNTTSYLDGVRVSIDPDQAEGRGPMALSFRTGQTQVIQSTLEETRFKPWKERAARCGLASMVGIPVRIQGLTIGVLAVYAGEPNFFTESAIHPFEQLVLAASHRLETLTQELSLQRLLRAYRAGHALNEIAALHVPLHQLCENACRILAEFLELGLCYIVEAPKASHVPIIHTASGPASGFLEGIDFSLDPTQPNYGLSGLVYTAGKPIIIDELENEPRLAHWRERLQIHALRSAAGFPLFRGQAGDVPWGTLILLALEPGYFDPSLVSHLEHIAHGLSLSIEEGFHRQKLFRVERFYSALGELGSYLATDPPLSILLEKTCELTSNTTHLPIVYVTLIDHRTQRVHLEAFAGPASDLIRNVPVTIDPAYPEGRGITGAVFQACQPVIVNNLDEERTIWLSEAERRSVSSIAGFPLLVNGVCHGVLGVGSLTPNFFDDELVGLLGRVADMVGTALNHSYEKNQRNYFEKLFRALSELHRLVARHPDPTLLYQEVRQILDRVGGAVGNCILLASRLTDATAEAVEPHRSLPEASAGDLAEPLRTFCQQLVSEATASRTPILARLSHPPLLGSDIEEAFHTAGIREIGVFPILFRGQAFAALVLLSDEDGFFESDALVGLCTQFTDAITLALTEYDRETELKQMALMDTLTGLPNRNLFFDRLDSALKQAERNRSLVGIAILDIDRFKEINDRFGHDAGDLLLATQAHRMEALLNDQSTVARLAGDEFGLILAGMETEVAMTSILERLRSNLAAPIAYQEQWLHTTVSLGLTIYPRDHQPPRTLMRHADLALYRAKSRGRNAWALYEEDFERRLEQQMETRRQFQRALAHGDIRLYLQPVIDLRDGRIVGAEACARWPGFGATSEEKADWLGTIEEDPDLIPKAGRYLLETVGFELETLDRAGLSFPVSLNIDLRYLFSPHFEKDLKDWGNRHGSHTDRLVLELKPSPLLPDWNRLPPLIEELRHRGIRILFDNFGVWPVALEKLELVRTQGIKIDRSLVLHLHEEPRALSLVAGALRSGEIGHFEVTAVGVEREDLAELFYALGGRLAQGFFASAALASPALIKWSRHWTLPTPLAQSLAQTLDLRRLPIWLNGPYHRWLRGRVTEVLEAPEESSRALLAALSGSTCSLVPWPAGPLRSAQRKLRSCHEALHAQLDQLIAASVGGQPVRSLGERLLERMREYEAELEAFLHLPFPPAAPHRRGRSRSSPKASPGLQS